MTFNWLIDAMYKPKGKIFPCVIVFFVGKDRHDLPLGDRYDPGNAGCLRQEQISDSYLFSNSFLYSITFFLVINNLL